MQCDNVKNKVAKEVGYLDLLKSQIIQRVHLYIVMCRERCLLCRFWLYLVLFRRHTLINENTFLTEVYSTPFTPTSVLYCIGMSMFNRIKTKRKCPPNIQVECAILTTEFNIIELRSGAKSRFNFKVQCPGSMVEFPGLYTSNKCSSSMSRFNVHDLTGIL